MSTVLVRLALFVLALALVIYVVGSLLPHGYSVSASVEIGTTPDRVFEMVNTIRNWQQWSPWNAETIPNLDIRYEGKTAGVGARQLWTDRRGSGKLSITESDPTRGIRYSMEYGGFPKMSGAIELEPTAGGTKVIWSSNGALPKGPFHGYTRVLFESAMLAEYDKSLNKLKQVLETEAQNSGDDALHTDGR
jgi:hypothetical protein